jgi:hypothetical protein
MPKKITFKVLCRKFRFLVIEHFLISFLRIILYNNSLRTIQKIFQAKSLPHNYIGLLEIPLIEKLFPNGVSQIQFISVGVILVSLYSLVHYYDSLREEELKTKGSNYIKNLLLDKFRKLTFEEKKNQKDKIDKLVEVDV